MRHGDPSRAGRLPATVNLGNFQRLSAHVITARRYNDRIVAEAVPGAP